MGAYRATSLGYVADRTRYKFNTKPRILCDQKDGYKFVAASTDENYSIDDYITMGFSALTESGSILRQKSVVVRFCVKGMMPNTELVRILNLPKDYTVRLNGHLCDIVLTGTALMRDRAQAVSETVNYAVEAFKNIGFQNCDYCGDSDESELYSYRYSFISLQRTHMIR